MLSAIFFIFYLAALICGAWFVSEGGDILGDNMDASVLGGLVIASLNTLPETIFFITALSSNQPNFALGAISGSVIVVCTIAVGLCIIIGANAIEKKKGIGYITLMPQVKQQAKFLMYSLVFVVATLLFGFQTWIGIGGCLGYAAFILFTLFNKKPHHHHHHQVKETGTEQVLSTGALSQEEEAAEDSDDEEEQPMWKGVLYLCLGGLFIYIFSDPFIQSVVVIGKQLGITPLALAFFFAPIASEAPEILESITLARRGKLQNINIAFSNLVGGTLSKTTLLTGILSFYGVQKQFEWISPAYTLSILLLLICAGAVASFGYGKEHRAQSGYALLALFALSGISQFIVAYKYGSESVLNSSVDEVVM